MQEYVRIVNIRDHDNIPSNYHLSYSVDERITKFPKYLHLDENNPLLNIL